MSKILELFGKRTSLDIDWHHELLEQACPYQNRKCIKTRKSDSSIAIGSCSILHGMASKPIIICPFRFIEADRIFLDCIHLLSNHEPGNDLHIIPEISIPGGSIDYFLVSVRGGTVKDFVGIELQTLDTTGSVWLERERFLHSVGIIETDMSNAPTGKTGINWKMSAKTILVQIHHKITTFEHLNKKLVLVIQDCLLEYLQQHFSFDHLSTTASLGDALQIHAYSLEESTSNSFRLQLSHRLSTNSAGVATCLGLQANPEMAIAQLTNKLAAKLSPHNLLRING